MSDSKHGPNNPWNEHDLLRELPEGAAETAKEILEWAEKKEKEKDRVAEIYWGVGPVNATFAPKIFVPGTKSTKEERQIFTLNTEGGGKIQIIFSPDYVPFGGRGSFYDSIPPFDDPKSNPKSKRPELVILLNTLLEEKLPEAETKDGITLPLAIFKDEDKGKDRLTRFFQIMEWVMEEVYHDDLLH
jgi:hypothetical protein